MSQPKLDFRSTVQLYEWPCLARTGNKTTLGHPDSHAKLDYRATVEILSLCPPWMRKYVYRTFQDWPLFGTRVHQGTCILLWTYFVQQCSNSPGRKCARMWLEAGFFVYGSSCTKVCCHKMVIVSDVLYFVHRATTGHRLPPVSVFFWRLLPERGISLHKSQVWMCSWWFPTEMVIYGSLHNKPHQKCIPLWSIAFPQTHYSHHAAVRRSNTNCLRKSIETCQWMINMQLALFKIMPP